MPITLQSVAFRSENPHRDADFWGAVLNRPVESDGGESFLRGEAGQVGIRFTSGPPHAENTNNRLHLHLADGPLDQSGTIAMCLGFGARLLGSGRIPENSYAGMADVAGDEFCVIEDRNAYLAGCGPLAEVTCEGTRTVGLFWSNVLAWPLVWDEGGETAIQSPAGGTKIAWNGESVMPDAARARQYFVLTVPGNELDHEVRRLLDLGASGHSVGRTGETVLRDPDGYEFEVRPTSAY
ncbi:VOC family protein [Mycetocola zhujimingii]|nr:VOC family protein [Mycetocola zhujimingii]